MPEERPTVRRAVMRPATPRRGRGRQRRVAVAATPWRVASVALALAITLFGIVIIHDVQGLQRLRDRPVTGVDYLPAAQFVADRHTPGEKILTALPAPVYLAVESTDDLLFLSSPIERKRAQRYTRLTEDGEYVDYWTGVPSVVDVRGLCTTLLNEPNLWLIVDRSRLSADWAFAGPMAFVIEGLTYVRYEAEGGAQVRRLAPPPARNPLAEELCTTAQTSPSNQIPADLVPEPTVTVTPEEPAE